MPLDSGSPTPYIQSVGDTAINTAFNPVSGYIIIEPVLNYSDSYREINFPAVDIAYLTIFNYNLKCKLYVCPPNNTRTPSDYAQMQVQNLLYENIICEVNGGESICIPLFNCGGRVLIGWSYPYSDTSELPTLHIPYMITDTPTAVNNQKVPIDIATGYMQVKNNYLLFDSLGNLNVNASIMDGEHKAQHLNFYPTTTSGTTYTLFSVPSGYKLKVSNLFYLFGGILSSFTSGYIGVFTLSGNELFLVKYGLETTPISGNILGDIYIPENTILGVRLITSNIGLTLEFGFTGILSKK